MLFRSISKFSFICFPYDANNEIHGFEYTKLNELAGAKVNKVARGGFFGGPKYSITEINSIYYGLLKNTLDEGFMGTEESIFSLMVYKHSDLINYFEIEGNGLVGKFFEDLKNDNLKLIEKIENLKKEKLLCQKDKLELVKKNELVAKKSQEINLLKIEMQKNKANMKKETNRMA